MTTSTLPPVAPGATCDYCTSPAIRRRRIGRSQAEGGDGSTVFLCRKHEDDEHGETIEFGVSQRRAVHVLETEGPIPETVESQPATRIVWSTVEGEATMRLCSVCLPTWKARIVVAHRSIVSETPEEGRCQRCGKGRSG